jgi:Flp pilus assembly protein TadB
MNLQISFLWFLILLFLSSSPINTIQAAAVPVVTKVNSSNKKIKNKKRHHKKQFKKHLKKLKDTRTYQKGNPVTTFLLAFAISWYLIAIALLITALVLGITPMLIAAIILLALPIVLAIIFGIVFLILLLTSTGDWC